MSIFEGLGATVEAAASSLKERAEKVVETVKEGRDNIPEGIKEIGGKGESIFPDFFKSIQDVKAEGAKDLGDAKKEHTLDSKQNNTEFTYNPENKDTVDNNQGETNKPENNSSDMARTPTSHGLWEGERGSSKWIPDGDFVPPEKSPEGKKSYSNPEQKTWSELLEKYRIDGVEFKDGYPDFSPVSKGNVEIEDFKTGGTEAKNTNFVKADIELAKQKGCSPEEVAKWRKENNYTWHECEDKKTMQKVPNEIHANIPHDGGRSQY